MCFRIRAYVQYIFKILVTPYAIAVSIYTGYCSIWYVALLISTKLSKEAVASLLSNLKMD